MEKKLLKTISYDIIRDGVAYVVEENTYQVVEDKTILVPAQPVTLSPVSSACVDCDDEDCDARSAPYGGVATLSVPAATVLVPKTMFVPAPAPVKLVPVPATLTPVYKTLNVKKIN